MNKVLVVVDMQKDFMDKDGALSIGHDTSKVKNKVAEFIKVFDGEMIFTADYHQEGDCEFATFPKHCLEESPGSKFVDEIVKAVGDRKTTTVGKQSYTSHDVTTTIIESILGSDGFEIHVVGVCTHIAVHDVIASIVNRMKSEHGVIPSIILHTDMIDDSDPDMAAHAIKRMKTLYGVKLV